MDDKKISKTRAHFESFAGLIADLIPLMYIVGSKNIAQVNDGITFDFDGNTRRDRYEVLIEYRTKNTYAVAINYIIKFDTVVGLYEFNGTLEEVKNTIINIFNKGRIPL